MQQWPEEKRLSKGNVEELRGRFSEGEMKLEICLRRTWMSAPVMMFAQAYAAVFDRLEAVSCLALT